MKKIRFKHHVANLDCLKVGCDYGLGDFLQLNFLPGLDE